MKKTKIKKKIIKKKKDSKSVETLKDIAKNFGSLEFLSDEEQLFILPTIFPSFNRASFIGGLPGGSIVELHGPNQGGKTALGIAFLVSAQKEGHIAMVFDYEGSFKDKKWPKALGLNLKETLYRSPICYEDGADEINEFIIEFKKKQGKGKFKDRMLFILIDSLTSMVPRDELEGKVGKKNFGLHANLTSQWLRKLNALIKGTNISVIFVNQERARIGAGPFEKKWHSAGGEALQFYAHVRIRVFKSLTIKKKIGIVGKEHKFLVEKNKTSAPDEEGYFYTSNGKGKVLLGFDMSKLFFKEAFIQRIFKKSGKKYKCKFDNEMKNGLMESFVVEKIREEKKFQKWLNKKFSKNIGK